MRLALDTNRYVDFARGDAELVELLESAESIAVPFVVLAELRAGFAVGRRGRDNERNLQQFLARPGVDVVFADETTTRHYAAVYRQLRAQRSPIPTHDLWVASLVLQHDLVLVSRDEHFDRLPQLARA